mmetsp:Transcript_14858/g.33734  ORF Transcript_14858/g.33734 Transcript_14858/m.33734 type:complete len:169 (+) Transcript_14858:29-535(+)
MSVLGSGLDLCCFQRSGRLRPGPSAPPQDEAPPAAQASDSMSAPDPAPASTGGSPSKAFGKGPGKGPGKGLGKGAAKGPAKGGDAEPATLTYKQKQEAELAAKEEALSAPPGFAGKDPLSDWEIKVLAGETDTEEGPYSGRKFMPTRGYFACKRCGTAIYLAQAKFVH